MVFPHHRTLLLATIWALLGACGLLQAHVVPNMTVEATFEADGSYRMTLNLDPRTFMAADPTTLPPVPSAWYRDQTPSQIQATHEKAREYLVNCLNLLFGGQKTPLPECVFQAIDGSDNTPIKPETQEVHLLASTRGTVPNGATTFQVDYAKTANTPLILLSAVPGKPTQRAQAVFAGETSPAVALWSAPLSSSTPALRPDSPAAEPAAPIWLVLASGAIIIAIIVGWRLLSYYRRHHRFHRKPGSTL